VKFTFGSLFSGIGGIDLGLERAGWTCKWQVEIDPYCQAVLKKHWPNMPRYCDVKSLRGDELEHVELICGGFPCQPVSTAGKRKGQSDERWLWPEFARIIRMVRPQFVLVENVPGILSISEGRAMGEVLGDLAASGYDAEWNRVSAASIGAPHLRERVFIVAYARHSGIHERRIAINVSDESQGLRRVQQNGVPQERQDETRTVAYTRSERRQQVARSSHANESENEGGSTIQTDQFECHGEGRREGVMADTSSKRFEEHCKQDSKETEPTVETSRRNDTSRCSETLSDPNSERGLLPLERIFATEQMPQRFSWWAIEPDVGRVAHGIPARVDRLRCLGNAVVPQVAEYVGKRIREVIGDTT